jgi:hypothetical protein
MTDLAKGARFPKHPHHGQLVRSRLTGRTGVVVGQVVHYERGRKVVEVFVRPAGGGVEWSASPGDLELT